MWERLCWFGAASLGPRAQDLAGQRLHEASGLRKGSGVQTLNPQNQGFRVRTSCRIPCHLRRESVLLSSATKRGVLDGRDPGDDWFGVWGLGFRV